MASANGGGGGDDRRHNGGFRGFDRDDDDGCDMKTDVPIHFRLLESQMAHVRCSSCWIDDDVVPRVSLALTPEKRFEIDVDDFCDDSIVGGLERESASAKHARLTTGLQSQCIREQSGRIYLLESPRLLAARFRGPEALPTI